MIGYPKKNQGLLDIPGGIDIILYGEIQAVFRLGTILGQDIRLIVEKNAGGIGGKRIRRNILPEEFVDINSTLSHW